MFSRLDTVPGIAGDDPAVRCFFLQRIQVLGLTGQHAHHLTALEQTTGIAFTHELGQVGAKQHVENRVRLGVGQCLHDAASVELAQRRRLLGDKFDVRLCRFQQSFEGCYGGLTVFVVGVHQSPTLLLQLGRFRHQHGGLHIGTRTQTVGVLVAAAPDDLVGQRLAGEEEELLLLGKVGHGQTGVGQEGAHQHVNLLA